MDTGELCLEHESRLLMDIKLKYEEQPAIFEIHPLSVVLGPGVKKIGLFFLNSWLIRFSFPGCATK